MKIVYIGWVGNKNIGDDLMLDNFKMCMKKYSKNNYGIYATYPNVDIGEVSNYDVVVLGGGSLLQYNHIKTLFKAIEAGKKVIVWGSGYDCMERETMDIIEKSNTPPYIYSDEQEEMLSEISEKAEFFGVRGPLTYKLLERSFIDTKNIIISGDPGLLLEEEPIRDSCPLLKHINNGKKIIAINYGQSGNYIFGKNKESVDKDFISLCKRLLEKKYKLYLYSMWDKDLDELVNLYNNLPKSDDLIIDLNLYKGGELLSILKKCHASINFKLHANIISAAANTPFVCIGYRFKSYDFVKSINFEHLLVPTDSKNLEQKVINKLAYINSNYKEVKDKLKKECDKYKDSLEDIFKNIL